MNQFTKLLKNYNIILASESTRRINLLKSLNLDFKVIPANINEMAINSASPVRHCMVLAMLKARHIQRRYRPKNSIIIAADTIVVLKNKILGKPTNEEDAYTMLKMLSGKTHFVYTGIGIIDTLNMTYCYDYSRTAVYFRNISDTEILDYIATGSPMDKAGAYGIQDDYGALFVRRIEGCYNNVIGLSLEKLHQMLQIMLI